MSDTEQNDLNKDNNDSVTDDDLILSDQTLDALRQFYDEKLINCDVNITPANIEENWQLSQFWYSEETANYLADEVINAINCDDNNETERTNIKSVVCISCPTLFTKLLSKLNDNILVKIYLLEFDTRFQSKFSDNYLYYDYNEPLSQQIIDKFGAQSVDVVIADPPFLSAECVAKFIETIQYLAKDKILVCSGAVVAHMFEKELNLKICEHFVPKHQRNLGNEFRCFSNFNLRQII